MADIFDVADFFIQLANQSEDDQMTNLKLNKLLYYAQGTFLARTGKPLFDNLIEAWSLGPVVPEVYRKYKVCGKNPIFFDRDDIDLSLFTPEEADTIYDVMREFGQYTGSKLVTLTHKPDTPWSNAAANGEKTLSISSIREYFLEHPVPSLDDRLNIPQVSVLPAEWYDSSEDPEWEGYL